MNRILIAILLTTSLFSQYQFDEWDFSEGKKKKGIKKQIIEYYDIDSSGKIYFIEFINGNAIRPLRVIGKSKK